MHNWEWVNLSKMAGFNISLSLNERQSSSDKKHNKSLRLVLFFPSHCCFAGSLPFSLSTVKQTKLYIFHSISEMFFTFLAGKALWVKRFSLNVCVAALQAAIKGGNFGAKLTYLCGFWLDVSFYLHEKKHRSRFWLDVSFFSHVQTIVRSSDWLELIWVRKFKAYIAFWWVFLGMYIIKKYIVLLFFSGLLSYSCEFFSEQTVAKLKYFLLLVDSWR